MKTIFLFVIISLVLHVPFNAQNRKVIELTYKDHTLPYGLKEKIPSHKPIISLALSGGGSRGFAQVGVLRALEEAGINIDVIVGTSMGSVIGGLYSSGYSAPELDSILINTDWDYLLSAGKQSSRRELFIDQKITEDKAVFTLRLKGLTPVFPNAVNTGQRLANYLNLLTLKAPIHTDSEFNKLKYDFKAVCTDLVSGKAVILSSGSLSQAMRASSSVTFLLSPVQVDSLILVDGGLVSNIPTKFASEYSDFTIAINTTSDLHKLEELEYPWIIADQIVSIPMKILNQQQLDYADFVFTPPSNKAANDFTNPDSMIRIGYVSALPLIQSLKDKIDSASYKLYSTEEYFINNIIADPLNRYEEQLLMKYSSMDSISNFEILRDLQKLHEKGDYKEIKCIIDEHKGYSSLHFDVTMNPKVKWVEFTGITILRLAVVDSIFRKLMYKPYNPRLLVDAITQILRLYRKAGYTLAELNSVSFDEEDRIIYLDFDEGIISDIIIEGNTYTNNNIIRREIPLSVGNYFYFNDLERGLINLRSTNLFEDVVLTIKKEGKSNTVIIKVIEKVSSLLRFGFRIDNKNKLSVSLDLRDENVMGTGSEAGILFTLGGRNRSLILEHKSNRIFDTYLTYKLNLFYKSEDIYTYRDISASSERTFSREVSGEYQQSYLGGSVSTGFQVERFGNLILIAKYQIDQLHNLDSSIYQPFKTKIVSIKTSTTIDTQDKYPYPENGIYFYGSYEMAPSIFGSEIGFLNIGFDYKNYVTINGEHTISPRLTMGFADKTLPVTEMYSLGGQESFFGMRENEFRGRQKFVASLEYRYKLPVVIFFDTYFMLRYDLGSIWEIQNQIRFRDLRHGIGATLSFDTPVGPADFSLGRSFLIRGSAPNSRLVLGDLLFYFSIGYYF